MFLFAVHTIEEVDSSIDQNTKAEIRHYFFDLKRTSMRKEAGRREGESSKRIPIEFDPINNQQCYVVVAMVTNKQRKNLWLSNQPVFINIFLSIEEADNEMKNVINNPNKFLASYEKFETCSIYPSLITID